MCERDRLGRREESGLGEARSIVVTGGGRGLGRGVAAALSRDGWRVAVTGRDAATLEKAVEAGDAHLALPGDAADRDAVAEAGRRVGAGLRS